MLVGVISDIHANIPALDTVLHRLENEHNVDQIVCLGDTIGVLGDPNAAIDRVRSHVDATILGNHDTRFSPERAFIPESPAQHAEHRLAQNITEENLTWLLNRPEKAYLENDVTLVHCRPETDDPTGAKYGNGGVLPREFTSLNPDGGAYLLGHTHRQHGLDFSKFDGKDGVVVNPGAVGWPVTKPKASYATFDTETYEFDLHNEEYDNRHVRNHLKETGIFYDVM